jgi:hypothetical protein
VHSVRKTITEFMGEERGTWKSKLLLILANINNTPSYMLHLFVKH